MTGTRRRYGSAAWPGGDKFRVAITIARTGGGDHTDVDGTWATLREISDSGAILVRPDNHVGWRSFAEADNATEVLTDAFSRILDS